jgi:hypothetical protein
MNQRYEGSRQNPKDCSQNSPIPYPSFILKHKVCTSSSLQLSVVYNFDMPKPTFVCVPGVSHSPLIFNPLKSELSSYGYEVIPLALPSVGARPVTYDFTEDVHTIRYIVSQLVESERDVIVVMHAYGGIPGSEALYGLGKLDRERRGLKGGVVRLVFIMSVRMGFAASPYFWATCIWHSLKNILSAWGSPTPSYKKANFRVSQWMVKEGFQASARGDVSTMSPYMLCDLKVGLFPFS